MVLSKLFGRGSRDEAARKLFESVVKQSRNPVFYTDLQVSDTVDGRFDMVTLHAYLILRRLKAEGDPSAALGQQFFDVMFDNFDENLRELGVGDIGIGRRIKKMASAFFGRVKAYDEALESMENDNLKTALHRNLYKDVDAEDLAVSKMAAYIRWQDKELSKQESSRLYAGEAEFSPLSKMINS